MVSVCLPSDALSQYLLSYLGFSPWTWGISSWLLQQSAATAPYLGNGVAPLSHCPWPWMWGISSWLLQQSAAAAPYLGRVLSPHSCPSWPWMWSSSSRPFCTRAVAAPWTSTVILVPEPYFLVWEHIHIHNFHWELWQGHMMKFYSRFSDEKTEAQGN